MKTGPILMNHCSSNNHILFWNSTVSHWCHLSGRQACFPSPYCPQAQQNRVVTQPGPKAWGFTSLHPSQQWQATSPLSTSFGYSAVIWRCEWYLPQRISVRIWKSSFKKALGTLLCTNKTLDQDSTWAIFLISKSKEVKSSLFPGHSQGQAHDTPQQSDTFSRLRSIMERSQEERERTCIVQGQQHPVRSLRSLCFLLPACWPTREPLVIACSQFWCLRLPSALSAAPTSTTSKVTLQLRTPTDPLPFDHGKNM